MSDTSTVAVVSEVFDSWLLETNPAIAQGVFSCVPRQCSRNRLLLPSQCKKGTKHDVPKALSCKWKVDSYCESNTRLYKYPKTMQQSADRSQVRTSDANASLKQCYATRTPHRTRRQIRSNNNYTTCVYRRSISSSAILHSQLSSS